VLVPLRDVVALLVCFVFMGPLGCSEGENSGAAATHGIASLSPAMTTIVQDLGAGDRLVGRTPWCRGVDTLPVVGALDGVDAEVLVGLRPEFVIHQPPAAGPDPVLPALRDRLGFTLIGGRLDGSADVVAAIDGLAAAGIGDPTLTVRFRDAMESVRRAAAAVDETSPTVLVLFGVDPFAAAGRDTYLDEVVRAAGGRNVTPRSGWIELSVEEVVGLRPEVVLLVSTDAAASAALDAIPWSARPAVVVLESPDALEPSTRMPAVVDEVRRLLAGAVS